MLTFGSPNAEINRIDGYFWNFLSFAASARAAFDVTAVTKFDVSNPAPREMRTRRAVDTGCFLGGGRARPSACCTASMNRRRHTTDFIWREGIVCGEG